MNCFSCHCEQAPPHKHLREKRIYFGSESGGLGVHQEQEEEVQAGLELLAYSHLGVMGKQKQRQDWKKGWAARRPGIHFLQLGITTQMLHNLPKQRHSGNQEFKHISLWGTFPIQNHNSSLWAAEARRQEEEASLQEGCQQRKEEAWRGPRRAP